MALFTRRNIGRALLVVLVGLQFVRPTRNTSGEQPGHISTKYPIPTEVSGILKKACNDCHSNSTVYPWYTNIQPVGLWMQHHVDEGKEHLNFDAFTLRKIAVQNHKLEEIIETVKEGEMPMSSYTWVHRDAALTDAERATLTSWAQGCMDSLAAQYPPDSLVLKRR